MGSLNKKYTKKGGNLGRFQGGRNVISGRSGRAKPVEGITIKEYKLLKSRGGSGSGGSITIDDIRRAERENILKKVNDERKTREENIKLALSRGLGALTVEATPAERLEIASNQPLGSGLPVAAQESNSRKDQTQKAQERQQKRENSQKGVFSAPFFTLQGQGQRIKNVAETLNIAFNPFSQGKIKGNTGITLLDKPLALAANHPYASAALGAGISKIPSLLKAGASKLGVLRTGILSNGAVRGSVIKKGLGNTAKLGIAAGAGLLGGGLLFGGGKQQSAPQNQTQQPQINNDNRQFNDSDNRQFNNQDNRQNNIQNTNNNLINSPNASIGGSPTQSPLFQPEQTPNFVPSFSPTQSVPSNLSAAQSARQQQDSASGNNILVLAAVALGAAALIKK
jgi:hypothetical protein